MKKNFTSLVNLDNEEKKKGSGWNVGFACGIIYKGSYLFGFHLVECA